jgi:hypothetical protein
MTLTKNIALTVVFSFRFSALDQDPKYDSYLNLFDILRVLRIARMHHLEAYIDSEVVRACFRVVFTVVLLLFATAGVVQIVENADFCSAIMGENAFDGQFITCGDEDKGEEQMIMTFDPKLKTQDNCRLQYLAYFKETGDKCFPYLSYFDCIYFCVVTITTVGYGDISPKSSVGMLVVSLFMISAIVIIPITTARFVEAMNMQNSYQRDSYKHGKNGHDHVIVCGCMSEKGVRTFFSEFYHEDNSLTEEPYQSVILSSSPPSNEIQELMKSPLEFFITYLQGHCMRDSDLFRASVHTAKACFVLSNKHSTSSGMEDAMTIMQALNIKRFVTSASPGRSIFMLIQLLRPENKEHLVGTATKDLALISQISEDRKVATMPETVLFLCRVPCFVFHLVRIVFVFVF